MAGGMCPNCQGAYRPPAGSGGGESPDTGVVGVVGAVLSTFCVLIFY